MTAADRRVRPDPAAHALDRRDVAIAGHERDLATARRGLASADPAVRATALGALERSGGLSDDDVRAALADVAATVRQRACELAARRHAIDISALLADPDDVVVEVAAFVCGERGTDGTGPDVVAALAQLATGHRDPLVREAAVAALGALGHPDGLAAILAATRDKPAIRRRAVIALTPFDGPEVDAALAAAANDRDWQVRQAAEDLA